MNYNSKFEQSDQKSKHIDRKSLCFQRIITTFKLQLCHFFPSFRYRFLVILDFLVIFLRLLSTAHVFFLHVCKYVKCVFYTLQCGLNFIIWRVYIDQKLKYRYLTSKNITKYRAHWVLCQSLFNALKCVESVCAPPRLTLRQIPPQFNVLTRDGHRKRCFNQWHRLYSDIALSFLFFRSRNSFD